MRFLPLLLAVSLSLPAAAQLDYDVISYGVLDVDTSPAGYFLGKDVLLVNTGTIAFDVGANWQDALNLAESTAPITGFAFQTVPAYVTLQPGEAIGSTDAALLSMLQPGETYVGPPNGTKLDQVNVNAPYPAGNATVDFVLQFEGRAVHYATWMRFQSLGGPSVVGSSPQRTASAPSPPAAAAYGAPCVAPPSTLKIQPSNTYSATAGASVTGDLPNLGNSSFGIHLTASGPSTPFVIGIDKAPGSTPWGACEILLGLTPTLSLVSGSTTTPFGGTTGGATVALPIPANPVLLGATAYLQGLTLGATMQTTGGLVVTVVDLVP